MEKHMPEGYKQTEVGMIPVDWQVKKIEEIALVKSGKRLPLGNTLIGNANSHPYIRVADMYMGGIDTKNIMYVPDEIFPKIENYRIFIDDIFISVAGTLGLVGRIPEELNGANLTENADKLTEIKCNQEYLTYLLMSSPIQKTIENSKTLGAQPKLALARIRNFLIPIPPTINEQKSIATTLSDIDNLITSLEQLIEKKKAIKQGTMQELLTGRKRLQGFGEGRGYKQTELGMIPEDWEIKKILSFATMKARIGWQGLTTEEYKDNGDFYLITGTDFDKGRVDWQNCHFVEYNRYKQDVNIQVESNDILVTKDGTIGKIAYVEETQKRATLNSGIFLIRIKNDSTHSRFLYYLLNSKYFTNFLNKLTAGSTINHLYQKDFISFSVPIPINIDEQIAISVILFDMDSEIEILETKADIYKQIKQGMMQNLLTGRIRLK